ncbi:MAG: protease modulator HflC [Candidatus Tritonobacter lacicola]|nr:protease modulator HflC [Candidatus Tritonobacter lacicola]
MKKLILTLAIIAVVVVALGDMFFIVDETKLAIVTRFGDPVRVIKDPWFYWKWPYPVETVLFFEKRMMAYDGRPSEFLTQDKKNIVANTFTCWKIEDPVKFLQTVRTIEGAEVRINDIVSSEVGAALGKIKLTNLISVNPEEIRLGEIMDDVTARCRKMGAANYGIYVESISMKRVNFPEQNKPSVFNRMRAEREEIAKKYRAEGAEMGTKIRAAADTNKKTILSEAYRDSEKIKGEGDREAMRIYAEAYKQDPEFYRLVRTLEAYRKFLDENTTVILSSDSELLELLSRENLKKAK